MSHRPSSTLTRENSRWSRTPDRGSCSAGPRLASLFSTLQPGMPARGRLNGAGLDFSPRGAGISGSVPAFRISHTPAHSPTPEPVPGTVCVFCCTLVLRERCFSLSVQVPADPAPFPAVLSLQPVPESCGKPAAMSQRAVPPLRSGGRPGLRGSEPSSRSSSSQTPPPWA